LLFFGRAILKTTYRRLKLNVDKNILLFSKLKEIISELKKIFLFVYLEDLIAKARRASSPLAENLK